MIRARTRATWRHAGRWAGAAALACALTGPALAGGQREEPLEASVRSTLQKSVADSATKHGAFADALHERRWLQDMSARLQGRMPDAREREDFLRTVHYEASRAGLEPELVLGLIQVESAFRKYAVSSVGARGYMQVMPFWVRSIGSPEQNLFHLRTNLRYGCTILRYYLEMERGDLFRALGRYNGSLGQPGYPNAVLSAWRVWNPPQRQAAN
jgi:soluble lytic murein transglycosylase-like protein